MASQHMAILDIRQRAGYLFLGVTLAQIILISAQVQSQNGVPILEAVTFGVFAEVQRAGSSALSAVQRIWSNYVGLRGVREENERLQRELARTQVQLQEERALADRARGLEELLKLRQEVTLETMAARVIASGVNQGFRTITIDKGSLDGLEADMAVIAPAGIVGRIVLPGSRAAKVQLLIDRNAGAAALVERSRAQAIVVGGQNDRLALDYVSETSDVAVGDVVVTSGIDGIFPKGFVIGRIESVQKSGAAYKSIAVRPAVDFSTLEEVLVVLTPPSSREAQGSAP
jgi:rod shape-determining protein MreC